MLVQAPTTYFGDSFGSVVRMVGYSLLVSAPLYNYRVSEGVFLIGTAYLMRNLAPIHPLIEGLAATKGYLSLGQFEKYYVFVTSVCARRTSAASWAFEHMHSTLSHRSKTSDPAVVNAAVSKPGVGQMMYSTVYVLTCGQSSGTVSYSRMLSHYLFSCGMLKTDSMVLQGLLQGAIFGWTFDKDALTMVPRLTLRPGDPVPGQPAATGFGTSVAMSDSFILSGLPLVNGAAVRMYLCL